MNPACFLDINVLFRLWHVYIHQTVWAIPERESLRLPSDGFWFHQSQEGVCQTSSLLKLLPSSNLSHSWVVFFTHCYLCYIQWLFFSFVVCFQRWGRDEDHDHWEAVERHACSTNSDWHTPRVWRKSDVDSTSTFTWQMQHHKTRGSSSLSPRRFIPRSWTTGSSMLHLCFSSRTWSNCLHPTMTESSTY